MGLYESRVNPLRQEMTRKDAIEKLEDKYQLAGERKGMSNDSEIKIHTSVGQ